MEQGQGPEEPVWYWPHSLNKTEHAYDKMNRDCLAVVLPVVLLRPHKEGAEFPIRTDKKALQGMLIMMDVTQKLASLRLRLSEAAFEVVQRTSIKHQAPDDLSRWTTNGMDESPFEDDVTILTTTDERPIMQKIKTIANILTSSAR